MAKKKSAVKKNTTASKKNSKKEAEEMTKTLKVGFICIFTIICISAVIIGWVLGSVLSGDSVFAMFN